MNEIIQKQDRRTTKTQRAIRNAFLQLMTKKDIERITIKEIADAADVDRKTVYNYYGGIHEIREELENELLNIFEKETGGLAYEFDNPQATFIKLAEMLNANLELYGQLMKLDYNASLLVKVTGFLKKRIREGIAKHGKNSDERIDLAAEYVTAGMLSAYRYWFNSDRKQSLEEFSRCVAEIVMKGIPAYCE